MKIATCFLVDHPDPNPDGVRTLTRADGADTKNAAARSGLFCGQGRGSIMVGHAGRLRHPSPALDTGRAAARTHGSVAS